MNRRFRSLSSLTRSSLLATALLVGAVGIGCGGSVAAEGPAATAGAGTKAPIATAAHGPVKFLGEALGDVPLRPDQRTQIEQLATEAESRHAAATQAHQDLALALADQVEKGSIDRAALQPKIDAAAAAFQQTRPADRAALEKLHAILDPAQRVAFVDALESRMHDRAHEFKGLHGKMQEWATDLKLSDEQKDQIRASLKDQFMSHRDEHAEHRAQRKEGHERGQKVFEAFKGDRFVMDEVAPPVDAAAKANKMADRMVGMAQAALPILTPEQRSLAAAKIRTKGAEMTGPAEE